MSGGIEDVIKASRAHGGFRKRGYFTLATEKAKAKVSEYALPHPFFYCLEFIQAAVALGAVYVDVATDNRQTILSFANAHYSRTDLVQMFDFLITTRKEDMFVARRRLAIGIAVALSLKRAAVVIETGDGTLDGSTRFELTDIRDDAAIGTPRRAINGTFIKVTHAGYINVLDACSNEENVLIDHCEYLPITLVVNGEMPFGFVSKRALKLHGYRHSISFDEGDLYGAVAVPGGWRGDNAVKILTGGIVITSMRISAPFGELDGVVTFDKLNKTASQYEIVRDERVTELKERLKRYVDQLSQMVDCTDEERLAYLIDRPLVEVSTWGEPYCWPLEGQPFPGMAAFGLDPRRDDGAIVHFVWETSNGTPYLIRTQRSAFPLPVTGKVSFGGVILDRLRFVDVGEKDKIGPSGIVTFDADLWKWIRGEINEHGEAMFTHFSALNAAWENERDADSTAPQTETISPEAAETSRIDLATTVVSEAAPSDGGDAPTADATGWAMDSAREVTAAHAILTAQLSAYAAEERAPLAEGTDTSPVFSVPERPIGEKRRQTKAENADETSAFTSPPYYTLPFPSPRAFSDALLEASATRDPGPVVALVHRFLYMNSRNHPYFETVDHRFCGTEGLPSDPIALMYLDIGRTQNSRVLINLENALVKKNLAACRKTPLAFFTLALLVGGDLKTQSLRSPDIPPFDDSELIMRVLRYTRTDGLKGG